MKKRIWSLLMVLCMVICLAAGCNKKDPDTQESGANPTEAVTDNKTEDGKSEDKPSNQNVTPEATPEPTPEVKKATYLSTSFKDAVSNLDSSVFPVKTESGVSMNLDVKVDGALKTMVDQMLSMYGATAPSKLSANLLVDIDQKDTESCVFGKLTFNGESLDAKVFVKDSVLYIGVPVLTDKYIKIDLSQFLPEEQMTQMPSVSQEDVKKLQNLMLDCAKELADCVSPAKTEDNATALIKNSVLGMDVSVTGTKYVDTVNTRKAMEAYLKFMKETLTVLGMQDQIAELEEDFDLEQTEDFTIEYVVAEDGGRALILVNPENEKLKFLNNEQYFIFSVVDAEGEEDNVCLYAKKTSEKKGNIYLVQNGEIIDTFAISYELLDEGIKLIFTVNSEAANVNVAVTFSKKGVDAGVKFSSNGEEWVNATLSIKERDYKAQSMEGVDVVEDMEAWTESFTTDKLNDFFTKTLGVSFDSLLEMMNSGDDDLGGDDDWDDSDYNWDDNDDWDLEGDGYDG